MRRYRTSTLPSESLTRTESTTDNRDTVLANDTAWVTAKEAAGVQCRFHDLRHTTVTRLLEHGVAFAVVADIMGWSAATSVRMAKRYGHIGASAKRDAMKRLDQRPKDPDANPIAAGPVTIQ
jgi:integrase